MSEHVVKFCPRCRHPTHLSALVCAGCGRPFSTAFPPGAYPPALKWFQEPVAVVLLLLFVWPVGLYCTWNTPAWSQNVKAIVTLIVVAPMILFAWCWVAGLGLTAGAMQATAVQPPASYARAYVPGQ